MTDKDETENGVSAVSGGLFKYLAIVCKVMWPAISSKGSLYSFVILITIIQVQLIFVKNKHFLIYKLS